MKKEKVVEILLALEEKYFGLSQKEKEDFARGQYYSMAVAYDRAVKIICSDEYAEEQAKKLGVEL